MQARQIPEPLRPPERRCRLRAAVLLGVLIAANAAAVSFPGRVPNDQEVPSLAPMLE